MSVFWNFHPSQIWRTLHSLNVPEEAEVIFWSIQTSKAFHWETAKKGELLVANKAQDPFNSSECYGTIPILRQQRNWVSGFRKMAIFADVQYYLCWRRVGGSEKVQKCAERNIGMVPYVTSDALNFVVCKHSSNTVLCLLRNLMHQTLVVHSFSSWLVWGRNQLLYPNGPLTSLNSISKVDNRRDLRAYSPNIYIIWKKGRGWDRRWHSW